MNHLFGWADVVAFRLGGETVRWSDLLGNLLGLATVALALRRSLWSWPVQITGAILLFGADMAVHLGGTAARQVAVVALAGYGWARWNQARTRQEDGGGAGSPADDDSAGDGAADDSAAHDGAAHDAAGEGRVTVRWATGAERAVLLVFLAAGTAAFAWLLSATHSSWNPLPDAYIFVGTLAAMLAQSRGWVEFWLVWIAVDVVGVPLAFTSGLPVSGFTYVVYFALVLAGLRRWIRLARTTRAAPAAAPALEGAPA